MKPREAFVPVLLSAAFLAGCGGGDGNYSRPSEAGKSGETEVTVVPMAAAGIKVEYLHDGSRLIQFMTEDGDRQPGSFPSILQFCDGAGGLVSVTELVTSGGNTGYAGGAPDVEENYPPCDDGRLTAEDFTLFDQNK